MVERDLKYKQNEKINFMNFDRDQTFTIFVSRNENILFY